MMSFRSFGNGWKIGSRVLLGVVLAAVASTAVAVAPAGVAGATPPATAPNAPVTPTATYYDHAASVSFVAPANGGSTITGYTVTATDATTPAKGGQTCAATDPTDVCMVAGLTDGDSYTFTVSATNSVGTSAASSASNAVTPGSVTTAQVAANNYGTSTCALLSNGTVDCWGSNYYGQLGNNSTTDSSTPVAVYAVGSTSSSSLLSGVSAITAGRYHTCALLTTGSVDCWGYNYSGQLGNNSTTDSYAPVAVVALAPTGVSGSAASRSSVVSWTGSSGSVSYTVTATDGTTVANGGQTCTSAATSCTVSGLTAGDSYTFTVTASNGIGVSAASTASSAVVPTQATPTTPSISNLPGSGAYPGSFTPVVSTNGDGTTSVTSSTPSVCTVGGSGLVSYIGTGTCTLVAHVGAGTNYTSADGVGQDITVSPAATNPGAPTITSVTGGNAQATIAWTDGASNGSDITAQTISVYSGSTLVTTKTNCSGSPCTVTGLTNGTSYTFKVSDTNGVGEGALSSASGVVTPATTPAAPAAPSATRGNASLEVSWLPPAANGSTIISYTATASPGGASCTYTVASPETDTCTINGLNNGTSYTVSVTATNGVGASDSSAPSSPVTPATNPGAPTITSVTGGNAQATIAWTDGASNGSDITAQTISVYSGSTLVTTKTNCSGSPCVVTGLTNGTSYTFKVSDTNGVGEGALSSASSPVTPATNPGAPTITSVTGGNAQATIAWTDGAANGSDITARTIYVYDGSTLVTTKTDCSGSPCTVTGLTNGTSYTFKVSDINGVGEGALSSASGVVIPLPVPLVWIVTVGGHFLVPHWSGVTIAHGTVLHYTATAFDLSGNVAGTCQTKSRLSRNCRIAGLNDQTAYQVTVTVTARVGTRATGHSLVTSAPSNQVGAVTLAPKMR